MELANIFAEPAVGAADMRKDLLSDYLQRRQASYDADRERLAAELPHFREEFAAEHPRDPSACMEGGVWVVAGADAAVPPGPSLAKCRSLSPACVPWVIVLQSPAQRELLRDTTAVLCPRVAHLDATAKTCAHEWPLYASVIKAASSKAVPVGYMLTNCGSHVPVREFLEALHRSTPTWFAKALAHLVIDVSATEELGIREFLAAHPSLSIAIVWCWFHVTQAWTRWFSSTAADAALRGADGVRHVNALRTLLNNVHASTTAEQEAERVAKVIAYTNEHNLPLCRAYLQKLLPAGGPPEVGALSLGRGRLQPGDRGEPLAHEQPGGVALQRAQGDTRPSVSPPLGLARVDPGVRGDAALRGDRRRRANAAEERHRTSRRRDAQADLAEGGDRT